MLLYFWLSGAFLPESELNFWMTSAQITGSSLTHSTTLAFLLSTHFYANRLTRRILDQLAASGSIAPDAAAQVDDGSNSLGLQSNIVVTIVGLVAGYINSPWDRVWGDLDGPNMFTALSIAVANHLTWMVVAHVITRRVRASNSVRRVGRDHAQVDLFRLDALLPFGRLGTQGVLMAAIAVSFSAFQALDAELRWINFSWAFGVGIPAGLALLFIPMMGIRRSVCEAKQRELARLNEAIGAADRDLGPDPLRYLGDLLQRRERVTSAREWPLDTTAISRIAIYFIIPPIAWVGGAIAEILIQAEIGSG
jgi:hypothetical protein